MDDESAKQAGQQMQPGLGSPENSFSGAQKPVKYFDDQFDDESVLFIFRKHPVVMRKGLIYSSVALLVGPVATLVLTYARPENPPSMTFFFLSFVASFVFGAICFLPIWMSWHFSIFIVTDQRLLQITQKGFFHRSVVDMGLSQIQMVNYEVAGLSETLFGFGTITMQTFVGDLILRNVPKPAKIQKQILEVLREQGISASSMRTTGSVMDNMSELDAEEN